MSESKKKGHFREVGLDTLTYGVMSGLSRMSGLLLLPLLTRALSTTEYGSIDFIATGVGLMTTSIRISLPSALARYYHVQPDDEGRRSLFTTLLLFTLGFGLLLATVGTVYSDVIADLVFSDPAYGTLIAFGCWIALLQGVSGLPRSLLRLERKIYRYGSLNIVSSVVYIGLTVFFVFRLKAGVPGVFAAQLLGAAASFATAIFFTRKYIVFRLSGGLLRRSLKYSLPLTPTTVGVWLNAHIDRLLLFKFVGLAGVGVFGVAARISLMVDFFIESFRMAWQPYSVSLIESPERNDTYRRMLNYYSGIFATAGLGLTAIGPELVALLATEEFRIAFVLIPWIVGAKILHRSGSVTVLGQIVSEKTWSISLASWIGMIVNALVAWVLLQKYGIRGAAIGAFVGEFCFSVCLAHFSGKFSDVHFDRGRVLSVVVIYVLGAVALIGAAEVGGVWSTSLVLRIGIASFCVALIGFLVLDAPAKGAIRRLYRRVLRK